MSRYLIVLLVALAGCVSPEARRQALEREAAAEQAQREVYRRQVHGQCRSYGFVEGTERWRECLMQVDIANRQAHAQQRAVILQQLLNQEAQREYRAMPFCSSLPAGAAGYARAQGTCR